MSRRGDAGAAAAEDENIAYLEKKLGLDHGGGGALKKKKKNWKRLKKEWERDGFAEDFADFLSGLDRVCDSVMSGAGARGPGGGGEQAAPLGDVVGKDAPPRPVGKFVARERSHGDTARDSATRNGDGRREEPSGGGMSEDRHRRTSYHGAAGRGGDGRLKRHMKGLINRLTDANIKSITTQITDLFQGNARGHIVSALTAVALEASGGGASSQVLQSLPVLLAALVTALHVTIGREVGAFFIEGVVCALDAEWSRRDGALVDDPCASKCGTLAAIIAHMYCFGALHSSFVYDVIRRLGRRFNNRRDIPLVTVMLRVSGLSLRRDNPVALKEAIVALQDRLASFRRESRSRDDCGIRFDQNAGALLDVLSMLKNNRAPELEQADLQRDMRKWLSRLRSGSSGTYVLRVSWDDLLAATSQGRWWLQGAAWSGRRSNGLGDDATTGAPTSKSQIRPRETSKFKCDPEMVRIARLHRMNTDVRCRIFCVLMGSSDFVQAFDRLVRLDLRGPQEHDIVRVLIECCGLGKEYNPYFSHLANRLCSYRRQFKFTFQLAFWDIFKQMQVCDPSDKKRPRPVHQIGRITPRRAINFAKLLAHMVRGFALSLSILKIVNFVHMPSDTALLFFRVFFEAVLLGGAGEKVHGDHRPHVVGVGDVRGGDQLVRKVFCHAFAASSGDSSRDGILLFLHRHVKPRASACRIVVADERSKSLDRSQTLVERRVILAVHSLTAGDDARSS